MMPAFSQLSPHGARRVELPGRYGHVVALSGPEPDSAAAATVLLIPGYTGSKEDFAPLLDGIAAAGFHPVALDLPGQYESPGPDDETLYLPASLGEVVAELVEALPGTLGPPEAPVLLLGHSYGGLVARGAVLTGAPIGGLTLLDSGPGRLPPGFRLSALDLGEPLLRGRGVEAAYAVREEVSARAPEWAALPAELRTFLRTRFVSSTAAALLGMAAALRTEPDRTGELAAALAATETSALVVAGEADDAWSVDEQKDMACRLGAPFATVDGAAHSPNTENPHGLLNLLVPEWRSWLG